MFIDYVTLLLINMVAGLAVLATFVAKDLYREKEKRWAPALGAVGLVAMTGGFYMVFTWPLPGPYNMIFGEMSIMFGAAFLTAGIAVGLGRDIMPVAIYGAIAGLASILLGARIINLGLTQAPVLSGIGFILTGAGGVLLFVLSCMKHCPKLRIALVVVLAGAALIWAWTGYMAYWGHAESFQGWKPRVFQQRKTEG